MNLLCTSWTGTKSLFYLAIFPLKLEATRHAIIFRFMQCRTFSLKKLLAVSLLLDPVIYLISKLALKSKRVRRAFPSLAVVIELWIPFLLQISVASFVKSK
jgi:hypothetical protein